jgi:ADP-ribosyl-[dinitrogen reductase] hydrolase
MNHDRARGALYGLAVGDALGTTLEFQSLPARPFQPPVTGPHVDITGGGPFRVVRGQVTDDTQMATCLATSLAELGRYDAADVARRYVAWSQHAFDIGGQTSSSLGAVASGVTPDRSGHEVWVRSGRRSAGNGALMRCAPIGVALARRGLRRQAALDDAAITHAAPLCLLANAAFCEAIGQAVHHDAHPVGMVATARVALNDAAEHLRAAHPDELRHIDHALDDLHEDLALAAADDPDLYGAVHLLHHQGYVRVAFRLAFWHLLHTPDPNTALIDVVNRGGDADTNGAITGALLGAARGASSLSPGWIEATLRAQPAAPWDGDYHPMRFERLLS